MLSLSLSLGRTLARNLWGAGEAENLRVNLVQKRTQGMLELNNDVRRGEEQAKEGGDRTQVNFGETAGRFSWCTPMTACQTKRLHTPNILQPGRQSVHKNTFVLRSVLRGGQDGLRNIPFYGYEALNEMGDKCVFRIDLP